MVKAKQLTRPARGNSEIKDGPKKDIRNILKLKKILNVMFALIVNLSHLKSDPCYSLSSKKRRP